MSSLTFAALILVALLIFSYHYMEQGSYSSIKNTKQDSCFRRCGVHNITHPFRLKDSPKKCGDKRYILSCEDNNQLILYYESFGKYYGKYYVQSINYNNFTIRLLDFNLQYHFFSNSSSSSSSLPPYSLGFYNLNHFNLNLPYLSNQYKLNNYGVYSNILTTRSILLVSCPNWVKYSSGLYIDEGAKCMNSSNSYEKSFYANIDFGPSKYLLELGLRNTCRIEFMYLTSWPLHHGNNNISCMDIRRMVFYGFELSWLNSVCKGLDANAYINADNQPRCPPSVIYSENMPTPFDDKSDKDYHNDFVDWWIRTIGELIALFIGVKFVLGAPCIIILLIYKWRQKHLSLYDGIEEFLCSDNNIVPIRYSYKDIKQITEQFKVKLGNGGYGSVFKGKLRSGRFVAVKLLDKAKSNGQDFVNEVATIGRIHHVNVVQLIGFCVEGSKRALIYEFMPNGSLEKYIFSHTEARNSLSCQKLYDISLGVVRGIEYLHNGCNIKILHFDIKPHNILLDENFNPKVSDFGLARLSPTDKSIVSLTAARGTIGYMAPELFYRNVGTISHKADVYSFGMLLMEMASRRKNLNALAEQSSKIYFPFWIYDQLHDGREVTIENDTIPEMKLAKKMMIVALWCIQTKPNYRPSMDKVLEMLEEEDGDLEIPNKPYFYPQDQPVADVGDDDISSSWSSYGTSVSDPREPT